MNPIKYTPWQKNANSLKNKTADRGESRIFSSGGGGADFQKLLKNFVDLF